MSYFLYQSIKSLPKLLKLRYEVIWGYTTTKAQRLV